MSAEDAQAVQSFVADGVVSQSSVFTHQQGQSLETVPQRIGAVAHYLQTQLRETLDTLPRPLSNLAVSTAFNLPSVCALTMARSALSAAVAEGVSGSAAVITGAACSALPLLLTLAAAGHHLYNGTATPAYLASQGAFLAVSALILGAALATGPATIFAGLAGSAPAVALYCLSRDLLQPFHGLGSNTGLSLPVNLVDGIAYGALQFAAGAAALWTDSGLVGALINGLIESVEPALNEELSAWMHGRDEAVDEQSFRLNYEVQVPGWRQIVTRLENTGIPRMTAFAINSTGVATAQHIGAMGLNDSQNYWLANGAGALLATYILTPFYQSHALQPGELAEVVVTRL
ncbi:hypothetical protein [Pseudomonas wadenswilerensis]|uniref:hypothetical protein n=1 Tax=Pseudomonas wadenswilerensis TaxID=1785161 RepID=UPI0039F0017E